MVCLTHDYCCTQYDELNHHQLLQHVLPEIYVKTLHSLDRILWRITASSRCRSAAVLQPHHAVSKHVQPNSRWHWWMVMFSIHTWCCSRLPVSLAAINAFQQSNVGFDEFIKIRAGCADIYCGDQHQFQSFSCELRFGITPHRSRRKHAQMLNRHIGIQKGQHQGRIHRWEEAITQYSCPNWHYCCNIL